MYWSRKTKLDLIANKRDTFQCMQCGKTDFIETHHKVYGIETLDNLITLCHSCHKKVHNLSGCFKKGFDSRRNLEAGKKNLEKGRGKFWGNQYTKKPEMAEAHGQRSR